MENKYKHFISLGYFCDVAKDLEKMGLRSFSSPFDWGISKFSKVIDALENGFAGFLDYNNLYQDNKCRNHYWDAIYDFYFYHDFNKYKSLDEQYNTIKDKYLRRINRLMTAIKEPTLFIRYISNEKVNSSGKSTELVYIEENYGYINNVIKKYNPENSIVFIGDESIKSECIKIYNVIRDPNDKVSRSPIISNKELYSLLNSYDYPNKEINKSIYLSKEKKKNNFITCIMKSITKCIKKIFFKEYHHKKSFN